MDLAAMMGLNTVVFVDQDEYVHENLRIAAPGVFVELDEHAQLTYWAEADAAERAWDQGWRLLTGWSSRPGREDSFIMQPSESVTGDLAKRILSQPGYYCAVSVKDDSGEKNNTVGWAVARRSTI